MKINNFFIYILFLFVVFFLIFLTFDTYKIKVQLDFDNLSAMDIEKNLVADLKKELLKIKEIKDIVIISKRNSCSVYLKINPFIFNNDIISKIQTKILFLNLDILKTAKITFDYDFDTKYDIFLVVHGDLINNRELVSSCDELENFILSSRLTKKTLKLGKHKKATYIYFSDSDLVKYDLTLEDIKTKISENNILQTDILKTSNENAYPLKINANFKNSNDISNVVLSFQDKQFSRKIGDVFQIVDDYKKPFEYVIKFDNENALVIAISAKNFLSRQLLKYKLKKYIANQKNKNFECKILTVSHLSKIVLKLPMNLSIEQMQKYAKKISELINDVNILYFISIDCPKSSLNFNFFEKNENKIILVFDKSNYRKIKNILKKNSFNIIQEKNNVVKVKTLDELESKTSNGNLKKISIKYDINEFLLEDYKFSKIDILNSLFAYNDGIKCTQYFDDDNDSVDVILKNKNSSARPCIYSKKTKNLIPLELFLKGKLMSIFLAIKTKNDLYFFDE